MFQLHSFAKIPNQMKVVKVCLATLSILYSIFISAQVYIPGIERINKTVDTTTLSLFTSIDNTAEQAFEVINPITKISFNSRYPRGYNDGPIWKGKGLTFEAHAGFQGKKGKLSYTFMPAIFFSENLWYLSTPDANESPNPYAYQFTNRIDWVQRYGGKEFFGFHPGQSEIKVDWGKIATSISTQNYSLGPSIYNPILLSRQGGGFPHARLEVEPTNIKIAKKDIGKIEANFIMGLLKESDYFDENPENDNRFYNSLSLAYSPSFLSELTVGFNKVLYKQTQFFEPEDLISTLLIVDDGIKDGDTISQNDTFDQMASIFMEWNIKKSGFRAYAEFAKNDFTTDGQFRFFAIEPEHARAYTIGFEKNLRTKSGKQINIIYEHTNLSKGQSFQKWRADPAYYAHVVNRQGYTHNGQIIGAGIGPGGNSDHFEISRIGQKITLGVLLQRIEHNKDYFVSNIRDLANHDVEYTLNLFASKDMPKATWFGELAYSYNYNRAFIAFEDQQNLYLSIGSRFKL